MVISLNMSRIFHAYGLWLKTCLWCLGGLEHGSRPCQIIGRSKSLTFIRLENELQQRLIAVMKPVLFNKSILNLYILLDYGWSQSMLSISLYTLFWQLRGSFLTLDSIERVLTETRNVTIKKIKHIIHIHSLKPKY